MNDVRTIDLGLSPLSSRCVMQSIAWPLYAWRCIVSFDDSSNIDILQKLLLSVIGIGGDVQNILIERLGLSRELIQTVKNECITNGYLSSDGRLTDTGGKIIANKNVFVSDYNSFNKKIYIFRDALSGDIVPNFSVTELPISIAHNDDKWVLQVDNNNKNRPGVYDIIAALRLKRKLDDIEKQQRQKYSTEYAEINEHDLEDEAETAIKREISDEKMDIKGAPFNGIKIWDDVPELIYVDSCLYIDPDKPHECKVRSPFGRNEDVWFTKCLMAGMYKDPALKEKVDSFIENANQKIMSKYSFDDTSQIELFKQFPEIIEDPALEYLKEEIESVKRAEMRIKKGDQDYDILFLRCQKALECLFELCIKKMGNKSDIIKEIEAKDLKYRLDFIASEMGINIGADYVGRKAHINLSYMFRKKSDSIKTQALFLLCDAYFNKTLGSLRVLNAMPEFCEYISFIANNRNSTAHFNKVSMDEKDLGEKADRALDYFYELVKVLFSCFFREDQR